MTLLIAIAITLFIILVALIIWCIRWYKREVKDNIDKEQKDLLMLIGFILLPFFSFSQDTVYVKKVYINGKVVKVKSGYIIKKGDKWEVNGKTVKLHHYKATEDEEFKPDTLIVNK